MSRFPEVCTSKKHFEQNLQRRGEKQVFILHACHRKPSPPAQSPLLPWGEWGSGTDLTRTACHNPAHSYRTSARGTLVWFLPFPAFRHRGGYHDITVWMVASVQQSLTQHTVRRECNWEPKDNTIHAMKVTGSGLYLAVLGPQWLPQHKPAVRGKLSLEGLAS